MPPRLMADVYHLNVHN